MYNDNPADASFCEKCGAKLELACPACKTLASSGARFCKKCGTALAATRPDSHPASSSESPIRIIGTAGSASEAIEGERKTVTALFADIKGSTELMETLDPEEARAIIDPALRIMIDAVKRYEGYVVQSTGDGIFALFGAPIAHEDHPQRALYAALQMQQELKAHNLRHAAQERTALEARVGINTGEVVVRNVETGGKSEYTPIGHTANLASRMQTAAPSGSITISEHTRQLTEGYLELRTMAPVVVKGIVEPINIYEVIGRGPLRTHFELAARRGLTRFVGRDHELRQLGRAVASVREGHGQLVAVVAEAGTGKSRLFYEFKASLPSDCKVLEAYSVSHGKASPWLPVLGLLHDYFGIQEADDPATRRERLRAALATLDPALSDTQSYLFSLLAIPENPDPIAHTEAQVKCRRTLDALKRIVLCESLKQPIVIIFEDLPALDRRADPGLARLAGRRHR